MLFGNTAALGAIVFVDSVPSVKNAVVAFTKCDVHQNFALV